MMTNAEVKFAATVPVFLKEIAEQLKRIADVQESLLKAERNHT